MPRPIKYSPTTTSGSYQKGNVAIGTNPIAYDSTWVNSPVISNGTFVVTEAGAVGVPKFYSPTNDNEWIRLAKQEGATGANTGSVADVKSWFASQANYDVANIDLPLGMPNIVGNGLVLNLDAGINESYPGSGTTWTDLSGVGNNGTLTNGPTFNTNGWFDFDGVDDYINGQDSVPLGNPCTVMALINCNSGGSGAGVVFGSSANGSDNWFEINNTSVQLFATRIADTDNFTLSGGTLVCDGTRWYNIAMTIDGATAKIYLDGAEVNSVTQQFTIGDWTGTFDIGRRGKVSQRYFKGSISNVIGYNKSLSEDELRQNYYQAPIVTDGLVLAVDAGNLVSYESGSTTAYSLTGSLSGSLVNGTGYLPDNGGIWDFDGTNDQIRSPPKL
jgi:hypothetical protein